MKLATTSYCTYCCNKLQLSHSFKSCVSLLLQQPLVDLNARDWQGKTPLHFACESGHHAFIEQLVAGGANVLVEDNLGRTPLYYAAWPADRAVREKLVDILLRCGAALFMSVSAHFVIPLSQCDSFSAAMTWPSFVRTTETRWKTANIDDGGVCVREREEPNNGGYRCTEC
ncbi:hypothetical protein C0Q70_01559 [Pomacea canaliculata]|uniref:Uncharacterized protein n=1 Tax=Pomacea canaliculata TaxID=400727 RepID=A0A2T7PZT6_POMCA|nr:hypothetical protein C0Q70_01559 [Pomacea canaliculata]